MNRFYTIRRADRGCGLGAEMSIILSLLYLYEIGVYCGLEVDFEKEGHYYDPRYGDNWWNYYFEPLSIGDPKGAEFIEKPTNLLIAEYFLTREENNFLLKKHIHFKKHLLDRVDSFISNHFQDNYIIGVFHRGTDKYQEAPLTPYEVIFQQIERQVRNIEPIHPNYKIFATSDEEPFIQSIQKRFPNRVVYLPDKVRSSNGKPIHLNAPNPYQSGEDALVDAILFSKTHYMMRSSCTLALISTFLSPTTPDFEFNKKYYFGVQPVHYDRFNQIRQIVKQGIIPYQMTTQSLFT